MADQTTRTQIQAQTSTTIDSESRIKMRHALERFPTVAEAREMARVLLRAADQAEGNPTSCSHDYEDEYSEWWKALPAALPRR